jgi:uncharacterized flavoprotein (TIGR03862 family)
MTQRVAIVGAGPAGLMAAEVLAGSGVEVDVFDAMPSAGRKFLLAGKGGLNLTHGEPFEAFVARYRERAATLQPMLADFGPDAVRAWARGLGVETFVGSSGRVFPVDFKAAPLLRAWLHRLRARGVSLHMRHRWAGWSDDGALGFDTPAGPLERRFDATVLALGGASWPQLGSDGGWLPRLAALGVPVRPLVAANCGFETAWSAHLRERFAGAPLKAVAIAWDEPGPDGAPRRVVQRGECVVSAYGLEGSLVYAASAALREAIARDGTATLWLDLLPTRSEAEIARELAHPRGHRSLATHLKSRLGLAGVKTALLHERLQRETMADPARLAAAIKALPIELRAPRPVAEAISSAGGVPFEALDEGLMLRARPGLFCAGEMLDWEAPTGGYLLTACLATGAAAGQGVRRWLARAPSGGTAPVAPGAVPSTGATGSAGTTAGKDAAA